jgi:hypothetical protein
MRRKWSIGVCPSESPVGIKMSATHCLILKGDFSPDDLVFPKSARRGENCGREDVCCRGVAWPLSNACSSIEEEIQWKVATVSVPCMASIRVPTIFICLTFCGK